MATHGVGAKISVYKTFWCHPQAQAFAKNCKRPQGACVDELHNSAWSRGENWKQVPGIIFCANFDDGHLLHAVLTTARLKASERWSFSSITDDKRVLTVERMWLLELTSMRCPK